PLATTRTRSRLDCGPSFPDWLLRAARLGGRGLRGALVRELAQPACHHRAAAYARSRATGCASWIPRRLGPQNRICPVVGTVTSTCATLFGPGLSVRSMTVESQHDRGNTFHLADSSNDS